MFKNPIILCSSFCKHSVEFVNKMKEESEKFEDVVIIKIDVDKGTNKRPQAFYDIQNIYEWKITSVPTVIVDNGKSVLSGEDAFEWVDSVINQQVEYKPSNLNVNEQFSNVGDCAPMLNDQEMKMFSSQKFQDKKSVENNYEALMKERGEVSAPKPKMNRSLSPPIKV